ncbi:MAG TPA: MFS transporter [Gammaproteobacteria bacterium]|nr:MFS transporter [Gammaproteobacteria bacterium]
MPLLALCLGFFMVIIDVTIVNVSLPIMQSSLGGNVSWLQWVVDGYTLTFACLLLSAGSLADRLGAKKAFQCGLLLFVLTSIGCALANAFWSLTAFRLLQGIAGAFLVPTSLALINGLYPDKKARAKAIGIWGSMGGIAAASGPILGGILTASFGWRAVFWVNVPIGLLAILLTAKYIVHPPHNPSPIQTKFDFKGQITGIISIAALSFSLIETGNLGWSSSIVLIGFLIFFITFNAFLWIEYHTKFPMLPLGLFKSTEFSIAIVIGMIINFGLYGELFTLPLYFHQMKTYSVLQIGLAILPLTGIVTVASYVSGKVISTEGSKLPMLIGLIIGALGFAALLITDKNTAYYWLILPLAAIGFGTAFTMPAATITAIQVAPENRAGIASGTFNASRQLGSLLGVALFGTIIASSTHFMTGMHITLIIGSALYFMGSLLAACLKIAV